MSEKIIKTEYSEEMQRSYMNYSMSVITSRAIPRCKGRSETSAERVLYDMSELHLGHDKPHRKSARIVEIPWVNIILTETAPFMRRWWFFPRCLRRECLW